MGLGQITEKLGFNPVGLALGAAGTIYGAIKSGQANKRTNRLIDSQMEENQARYDNSRNYFDTNEAKYVMEKARENLVQSNKQAESKAAITGASDEAALAAKTANQEGYNDQVGELAARGTQYENEKEGQYLAVKQGLVGQKMGMQQQQAQSASNLMSNSADLISGSGLLSGLYGKDKKE